MRRIVRLIWINLLVLLALWMFSEVILGAVLRSVDHPKVKIFASHAQLVSRGQTPIYTPHRYIGYIPTPGYEKDANRHNSLGYRGDEISLKKPPNSLRIACIGGSTTYGTGVDDYRHSYPSMLEEMLNQKSDSIRFEVINAGAGSWSTWESLVNYQFRVNALDPDILVVYHGLNDIHSRLVWPSEVYLADNAGRRGPNIAEFPSWTEIIAEKSNVIRSLLIGLGKRLPALSFSSIDNLPTSSHHLTFKGQYERGNYPKGLFESHSVESILKTNRPTYFKQNLENLIALAKSKGQTVVLMTFKVSPQFPDLYVNSAAYRNALDEHNTILRELTKTHGLVLIDLAQKLPDDADLYTDGRHLNVEGNRLKAELVQAGLIEMLVPDSLESR